MYTLIADLYEEDKAEKIIWQEFPIILRISYFGGLDF